MGKIKRGILGGFSGKVANVVGSSWKGIDVMRSLPLSVANPRTNAQIKVRTQFKDAVVVASALLSTIVKPLWDRFAQEMSGYNDFIKANYPFFADGNIPGADGNLIISQGKLGYTPIDIIDYVKGNRTLTLTWSVTPQGSYQQGSDEAYVVVYNGNGNLAYAGNTAATRADGTCDVVLYEEESNDTAYIAYLAFRREDGTMVGDTSYKRWDQA